MCGVGWDVNDWVLRVLGVRGVRSEINVKKQRRDPNTPTSYLLLALFALHSYARHVPPPPSSYAFPDLLTTSSNHPLNVPTGIIGSKLIV